MLSKSSALYTSHYWQLSHVLSSVQNFIDASFPYSSLFNFISWLDRVKIAGIEEGVLSATGVE